MPGHIRPPQLIKWRVSHAGKQSNVTTRVPEEWKAVAPAPWLILHGIHPTAKPEGKGEQADSEITGGITQLKYEDSRTTVYSHREVITWSDLTSSLAIKYYFGEDCKWWWLCSYSHWGLETQAGQELGKGRIIVYITTTDRLGKKNKEGKIPGTQSLL